MAIFHLKRLGFTLLLLLALPVSPAWAVLTVESSDVPGIEIDKEYPDDHIFDLPTGATVALIKRPSVNPNGDTHTLKGPYKGTLEEYIRRDCGRPGSPCANNENPGGFDPKSGGTRGAPEQ